MLRLSIEDGDVLDFALVHLNGFGGAIADVQLVVLIEQEFSPAVGCSCQHVVEALVVLYQIGEDMLRIILAVPQDLHVVSFNGDVDKIILVSRLILIRLFVVGLGDGVIYARKDPWASVL